MNLKVGDRIYSILNGKDDYRIIHSVIDNDWYFFQYQDGSISITPFNKETIKAWFKLDNSHLIREKLGVK